MSDLEVRPKLRNSDKWIFGTMLFSACLSLLASFVLSVDAIKLAANPSASLSCNINAAISCGAVGNSWQASLFGFPNAFLGMIAEAVVITIAVAALGGTKFPRWFMFSAQIVYTLGLIFAYWLFAQSMFVIGALCPWCLLITLSTTLVFASLTKYNLMQDNLYLPRKLQAKALNFTLKGHDMILIINWLAIIVAAILIKYGPIILDR